VAVHDEQMSENALILSVFENRLRAGLVYRNTVPYNISTPHFSGHFEHKRVGTPFSLLISY